MKIEQSDISFFSSHEKYNEIKEQESLNIWNSDEEAQRRSGRGDRLDLSQNFKTMKQSEKLSASQEEISDIPLDSKMMSIVRALEALIGKKINISFFRKSDSSDVEASKQTIKKSEPERLGWGVEYSYNRSEIRKETLDFFSIGSVRSEDGREIEFKLAFSMQKSSSKQESVSFKAGDALIDPLVLNFGSETVTMSSIRHNFDLNLDGKSDEFSFVGSGSGFLALDKNSDGIINSGSELFGPTMGNGFEELSKYDTDNNRWIDENDAIFEKLLIWTKDENGDEKLFSLKDKGVGALYLERASTSFDLEDPQSSLLARMRESSIYIRENGGVGTLQEIDLKI